MKRVLMLNTEEKGILNCDRFSVLISIQVLNLFFNPTPSLVIFQARREHMNLGHCTEETVCISFLLIPIATRMRNIWCGIKFLVPSLGD